MLAAAGWMGQLVFHPLRSKIPSCQHHTKMIGRHKALILQKFSYMCRTWRENRHE